MATKIIHPNGSGGVSVIYPSNGDTQSVIKDVPEGQPYLVIDEEDIPADRAYRNAWEADFSDPDGYGGGA